MHQARRCVVVGVSRLDLVERQITQRGPPLEYRPPQLVVDDQAGQVGVGRRPPPQGIDVVGQRDPAASRGELGAARRCASTEQLVHGARQLGGRRIARRAGGQEDRDRRR